MISGDYRDLTGSDILYNRLKYFKEEDSDLSITIVDEYDAPKATIMELITELERVRDDSDYEDDEKGLRIEILQILIAQKLDLADTHQVHYLIDSLHELFNLLEKRLTEIEKYKQHRHKTVLGLYTEKSVY